MTQGQGLNVKDLIPQEVAWALFYVAGVFCAAGRRNKGKGDEDVNEDDRTQEAVKHRFAESLRGGEAFQYIRPTQTDEWWQLRTTDKRWLRFNRATRMWEPQTESASGDVQKSGACWFEVGPDKWARWNPASGTAEPCHRPPLDPVLDHVRTIIYQGCSSGDA